VEPLRRLSRSLKPQLDRFDLFHLVDHSYSQLIHDLPPGKAVITCHDLDTFRCVLEPASAASALVPRHDGTHS